MIPKPDTCKGCPFYGDGQGFVPDKIVNQSRVLIVAQNPGASEEAGERWTGTDFVPHRIEPLTGKTGYEMDTSFLPLAGLQRDQVSLANVFRCRHRHDDRLPLLDRTETQDAIRHCQQYNVIPPQTQLIVAMGEYALWALTQHGQGEGDKISDWRGYVTPYAPVGAPVVFSNDIWVPPAVPSGAYSDLPVLAVYHLAYLFRDMIARPISRWDWAKIPRILNRQWPTRMPVISDQPFDKWPSVSAFDTEYVPDADGISGDLICYSVYDGHDLRVIRPPINRYITMTGPRPHGPLIEGVVPCQKCYNGFNPGPGHVELTHKVYMHNAVADIPFLEQILGDAFTYEDTMHQHAVLWSDFRHDLGFLGSIYGSLNRWKHLSSINPIIYSAADAYVTWSVGHALAAELKRDPASDRVYRDIQLRLVPIIRRARQEGIRVNQAAVQAAYDKVQTEADDLAAQAEAIAGWPINLRSDQQVGHHFYTVEELTALITGGKK